MAKKTLKLTSTDIVLSADAETIQQALKARVEIDRLLEEREAAYQQIAELELQVENVLGETSVYPFPAPPLPVAGYTNKGVPATRPKPAKPKVVEPIDETTEEDELDSEVAEEVEDTEAEDAIETVEDVEAAEEDTDTDTEKQ